MKDGKNLDHTDAILRIENVKKEDKGMYQCVIKNDQESAQATSELKLGGRCKWWEFVFLKFEINSFLYEISVDPPVIREAFSEETLQPGPSVFLKCIASGNPTPEIQWELDGKKISNSERFQVGQYVTVNGDVVSYLNITSANTKDGGLVRRFLILRRFQILIFSLFRLKYKCIASSKVGSVEHHARINIYGAPYVRPMEKKSIVSGENLFVTCPVAGYPIESIVWERGNLLK